MALQTYVDTFNVSTASAGTTIVRTEYGFAPKALLLWCSGRAETIDAVGGGSIRWCTGFATSPTARHFVSFHSEDGVGTADADSGNSSAGCLGTNIASSGAFDGVLDIQTFDSDGVTFIIDDAFAADVRVTVWAIGGSDITNAAAQTFTSPTVPGNQTVTVTGSFQPSIVFLLCHRTSTSNPRLAFGYGISATQQGALSGRCRDGVTTTDTARYATDTACLGLINTAAHTLLFDADFVGMTSTGFTLNWAAVEGTARPVYSLAIAGGSWAGIASATRTDGTAWSLSGLPFTPAGCLVASAGTTAHTRGTTTDHLLCTVGAAASATNRSAQGGSEVDNTTGSQVATILEHDAIYARLDLADGIAGLMDVQSFDSTGITFVMDTPDPDAAFFWAILCGNPAAAGDTRNLTATIPGTTTTPDTAAQQSRPLGAILSAATTTLDVALQQARAITALLPGSTNTFELLLLTLRVLSSTTPGTTSTPNITHELPTTGPVTTLYLQDRTLATLWAVEIRSGTMYWNGTTGTADAEPVLLDQGDLSTLWTLYMDNSVLRWEVAGATPVQLLMADTVTSMVWDVQIVDGALTWVPTFGLTASPTGETTTPFALVTLARALTAALPGSTTTPDSAIQMAGMIQWLAQLTALTSTPEVLGTLARGLTAALPGSTTTPDALGPVTRALAVTIPAATQTPDSAIQMAGMIQWLAQVSGSTATLDDVLPVLSRALIATVSGSTQTSDSSMQLPGMVQWLAQCHGATLTPGALSTVLRPLTALVSGSTVTPDALATPQRALIALIPGMTQTTDSASTMATYRTLTAGCPGSTATPDSGVLTSRRLTAVHTGSTLTSDSTIQMAGLLYLAAASAAETSTPLIVVTQHRHLLALVSPTTQTTDSTIDVALRRPLTATLPLVSLTADAAVQIAIRRPLVAVIPAVSTTQPVDLRQGVLTATLPGSTTTPDTIAQLARALTALLPGLSTTPPVDLRLRAFVAVVPGLTNTPPAFHVLTHGLTATSLGVSNTFDVIRPTMRRALNAQLPATTNTFDVLEVTPRRLTAVLTAATTTPDSAVVYQRNLVATLPGVTQTSVSIIQMPGVVQLSSDIQGHTTTFDALTTRRQEYLAAPTGVTQTPDTLSTVRRRLLAVLPGSSNTFDLACALTRNLQAMLALSSTTPTALLHQDRAFFTAMQGSTNTPGALVRQRHALLATLPAQTDTSTPVPLQTLGLRATIVTTSQTSSIVFETIRLLAATHAGITQTPAFFIFMTGEVLFTASIVAETQTPVALGVLRLPVHAQVTAFTTTTDATLEPGTYLPAIRPPPAATSQGFALALRPDESVSTGGFAVTLRPAA